MTPEAQRIAIAEACGWTKSETLKSVFYTQGTTPKGILVGNPPHATPEAKAWRWDVPDYLSDLNACHEMEKALTDDQAWEQIKIIVSYEQHAGGFPLLSRDESIKLHSATAPQRCEAFLRTLGLWTATPTQEK